MRPSATCPTSSPHPKLAATGLGFLTLAIVFGTPRRLNRVLPAPLLALIVCTLLSLLLPDNSDLMRIGEIPTGLPKLQLPTFQLNQLKDMLGYGVMLAMLGAIDSLLTSLVADNITRTEHNSDRELIGQGSATWCLDYWGGCPGLGRRCEQLSTLMQAERPPSQG